MSAATANNDGVVNPSGSILLLAAPPIFAAGVPVCNFIASKGGLFEKALNGFISASTFVASAGTTSSISSDRVIPALSAIFLFSTYALAGASSAAAIGMSSSEGRSNEEPRAQVQFLRGLPLRMHSAHAHMMETFPAFALAAGLTMTLAPTNQTLLNLLGLHVMAKLFVFWPSYIANVGTPRSLGHVLATSSLVSVAWKLTVG